MCAAILDGSVLLCSYGFNLCDCADQKTACVFRVCGCFRAKHVRACHSPASHGESCLFKFTTLKMPNVTVINGHDPKHRESKRQRHIRHRVARNGHRCQKISATRLPLLQPPFEQKRPSAQPNRLPTWTKLALQLQLCRCASPTRSTERRC